MKKAILTLLLAAMSTGALAEWVKVAETKIDFLYFDPTTIRNNGNMRRVWELQDLKQGTQTGIMSVRALSEYDCKEERFRTLSVTTHSEPMAVGRALDSGDLSGKWHDVPPSSIVSVVFKAVCAK
jgi:hypothetical protein